MTEFVFMLTHHDTTVTDAHRMYEDIRDSGLRYIGFKDIGASPAELADITRAAHDDGLEVMLEVVSTSKEDELGSLRAALDIGVDWVLGGTHPEEGSAILGGAPVRYCPFPGEVTGHPSVLGGTVAEIAGDAQAKTALDGVHGLDLLAYRHASADPVELIRAVVAASAGPVIVAGSVAGLAQISQISAGGAWGFTIGGAIFEGRLPGGPGVASQIRAVLAACAGLAGQPG